MGKTTKYEIPYPEPENLADIPKDAKTTVEKIEETIQTIDTATKKALDNKVDKEEGKGLSTNDYTNEDKAKLIPTGGTTGQVLVKKSDANNDVEWVNQTGVVATVVDSLESTSATDALSAKKGKELNEKITRNSTYSTEEQAVGTWIDGKTIYRKVIIFGALPNATKKEVQHNISNIRNFTKIEGIAIRNDETKFTQSLPLVYKNTEMFYNTALAVDNTIIEIQTTGDRSMFNGYVILEYTKTTD